MRTLAELKPPGQPDPTHLHRVFLVDHFCISVAGIIALINLLPGLIIALGQELPRHWLHMRLSCVVMTIGAVLALYFSEPTQSRSAKRLGAIFGILTLALAAVLFWMTIAGSPSILRWTFDRDSVAPWEVSLKFSYGAYLLVSIAILFASSKSKWLGWFANGLTFVLSFVVFTLLSGLIFRFAGIPGSSTSRLMSTPALWCVALLTFVLVLRRTEESFLSFIFAFGTGGRIARLMVPIVVLLPTLREIARAHLLSTGLIPTTYVVAFLTSVGTFLGLSLLFILVRIINRMQERIQNDSLKDELTGLFSLKGFYLLAEQSFRQARRTQQPYAILFVDMDNLKTINDKLGHSMGSVALVETAKLLTANFRDTDIVGRVGGDEFVVAGQFKSQEIAAAVERLREAISRKNDVVGQRFSISLSLGWAVAEKSSNETLQSLVAKADELMYVEKRGKKGRPTDALPVGATQNGGAALRRVAI